MQTDLTKKSMQQWFVRYRSALAIATLAIIVMLPALGHRFVNWDDDRIVVNNPAVTTTEGIVTIWSTLELPEQFPNYPLTMSMYWLEHQLWGLNPMGYHIVSMLVHAVNAVLVLLLLRRLGLHAWASLFAAALFAVHPMQVESVAWVAERKNLLFTSFSLLSLLAYLSFLDSKQQKYWWWCLAAFMAALLSKTAAVTLPVTLAATLWLKRDRLVWRELACLAPFFVLALMAGLVTTGIEQAPRDTLPLLQRPLLAVNALAFYLARLVFPVTVMPVHPKWEFEPGGVFLIAPIALLIVMGLLFRYRNTLPKVVWWSVVHFLATLGPFLGLVSYGYHATSYVADRYVYFASLGLFVPIAVGLVHVLSRYERRTALSTICGYVAVLAIVTLMYVPVWRDSLTLWTYTIKHNPDCGRAHNNLGTVYSSRGELDLALAHYAYAMRVDPMLGSAPANYAATMGLLGNNDEAVAYYMRSIQVEPANPKTHYRLACVLLQQERFEDALVHLRIATRLDATDAEVYNAAGYAHERLGNLDKADYLFRKTLELNPDHPLAGTHLEHVLELQREAVVNAENDEFIDR